MEEQELSIKQPRLGAFLDRHKLDGVLLTLRSNFAWITGGCDNHIANNSPVGVASILATRNSRLCLANAIEAPRMRLEELAGRDIEIIEFSWWDGPSRQKVLRQIIGGRKIAADSEDFGLNLPRLPDEFNELRWSLTAQEIERYRIGCKRTSAAMEITCRSLRQNMSEHEIAGLLDDHIRRAGCNPLVTLIAADERIERFRHPVPTDHRAQRYVMLVTCAQYCGLVACLTRFVSFAKLSDDLKKRQQAVCNIDAAVNLATRPGRSFGEIFADLQRAYADNSFPDEWQLHHQGGSTGYAPREAIATPGNRINVRESQPFAWNPSIAGVKSEDTVLCTSAGIEVLTKTSQDWPTLTGRHDGHTMERPDILVI